MTVVENFIFIKLNFMKFLSFSLVKQNESTTVVDMTHVYPINLNLLVYGGGGGT
jgi:hypothetical protein